MRSPSRSLHDAHRQGARHRHDELFRLLRLLTASLLVAGCAASSSRTAAAPEEPSLRPGINEAYLAPDLDVDRFTRAFESESREIFAHRQQIVGALDLSAGMSIADVGAGTGLFLEPFAVRVGSEGRVYAVDISPGFVAHLRERARKAELDQVEVVLGSERSAQLPAASIDLAFVCDTYHHFEYPKAMLASLHRALRPGGKLVVIDFERIPGVSRDWVLGHVRVGKQGVVEEIEAAGFVREAQLPVEGLIENYLLRFRRP